MKYIMLSACLCFSTVALADKPSVDPAIENIRKVAKLNASRYAVLEKTINRYDPAKTNMFARPARASMQTKLDESRKVAAKAEKVEKAAEKAKKKDSKTFSKWVSDTEKAKNKSSDEMAEFYDSMLELAHAYEEAN